MKIDKYNIFSTEIYYDVTRFHINYNLIKIKYV